MRHRFGLVLEQRWDADGAAAPTAGSGMVVSWRGGVPVAKVERSAATFADTVLDAIVELEGTNPGWRVVRVEPDELVSATAIARRLGRTRQSVAQLIAGARGPGGFPAPVVWVDAASRLWRWTDIVEWSATTAPNAREIDRVTVEFVAMLNGELQARRHRERLALVSAPGIEPGSERFAVEAAFPPLGQGRRWRGASAELSGATARSVSPPAGGTPAGSQQPPRRERPAC